MEGPQPKHQQTAITDFTGASWQMPRNKRKIVDSPTSPPSTSTSKNTSTKKSKSKNTLVISTNNKFSALSVLENREEDVKDPSTPETADVITPDTMEVVPGVKKSTPPPIMVSDVANYKSMMENILRIISAEYVTTKSLANDVVKISVSDIDSYRRLIKDFRNRGITFYTYQIKTERAFRVVIRGLHQTCSPEDIKEALLEIGFEVRNVVNIRHHRTKDLLPLFFVDLEPQEGSKKIYDVKTLLYQKIRVETPRPKTEVTQCQRCQQFGHTKTYCTLPHVCVKCGQAHDNRLCTKKPEEKPKCGLCKGEHTANYRGCPVYLKIKRGKSTFKATPITATAAPGSPSVGPPPSTDHSNAHNLNVINSHPNRTTYAHVVSSTPATQDNDFSTSAILSRICAQFEILGNQMRDMFDQNKQMLNILLNLVNKLIK